MKELLVDISTTLGVTLSQLAEYFVRWQMVNALVWTALAFVLIFGATYSRILGGFKRMYGENDSDNPGLATLARCLVLFFAALFLVSNLADLIVPQGAAINALIP